MPHVDAGFNLARWLLRHDADAEDAVQTAAVRAFQNIDTFRGTEGKSWFLAIVRTSCLNAMRSRKPMTNWDEAVDEVESEAIACDPERVLLHKYDAELLEKAIGGLSPELREMIVLRDSEGLAYKEIADVVQCPIGTVMSRLSRARRHLQNSLVELAGGTL